MKSYFFKGALAFTFFSAVIPANAEPTIPPPSVEATPQGQGALRSGSGLGGAAETPIAGSQIFSTTFAVPKDSVTNFVLTGLLELEKVVADYNNSKGTEAKKQEAK